MEALPCHPPLVGDRCVCPIYVPSPQYRPAQCRHNRGTGRSIARQLDNIILLSIWGRTESWVVYTPLLLTNTSCKLPACLPLHPPPPLVSLLPPQICGAMKPYRNHKVGEGIGSLTGVLKRSPTNFSLTGPLGNDLDS